MPRQKAEKVLEALPNGTFLLRESDARPVCVLFVYLHDRLFDECLIVGRVLVERQV